MSVLWKFCCGLTGKSSRRQTLFLLLHSLLWGAVGFLLWLLLRLAAPDGLSWAIGFAGCGCIIGFYVGILYLYHLSE